MPAKASFEYIPLRLQSNELCPFLFILLLCMAYIYICSSEEEFCFDANSEDHRLNSTSVLQRLQASSGPECVLLCLQRDKCCRSINFRKNSQCERNCELLRETAAEQPELLVHDRDSDHYVLLQPKRGETKSWCPDSQCLNGGVCEGGCGKNNSRCKCPTYRGKYCNESLCADALNFRGSNTDEYGILNPAPSANLTSFTISFWMKTSGKPGKAMLSYAYKFGDVIIQNGLLVESRYEGFEVHFHASPGVELLKITGLKLYKTGKFRHVCITWQSIDGKFVVYLDGTNKYSSTETQEGKMLPGGGIWVIGQDQDNLGGGFESSGAFGGDLVGINIWDKVLPPTEIANLSSSCVEIAKGNYVAYSDFNIHGNVARSRPDCCNTTSTK